MTATPPAVLLDANVLIALTSREHISHDKAMKWLATHPGPFATCPITQGALVRFHLRLAPDTGARLAQAILQSLESQARHQFWPDDLPYSTLREAGLRSHHQVTDFYLASLARARNSRLLTLDRGLAAWRPDDCLLID